jgi:hypothetical protein
MIITSDCPLCPLAAAAAAAAAAHCPTPHSRLSSLINHPSISSPLAYSLPLPLRSNPNSARSRSSAARPPACPPDIASRAQSAGRTEHFRFGPSISNDELISWLIPQLAQVRPAVTASRTGNLVIAHCQARNKLASEPQHNSLVNFAGGQAGRRRNMTLAV